MSEEKVLKVTTPKFRMSFPAVFVPKSYLGGAELYSLVMLFNKSLEAEGKLNDMVALIKATAMEEWGEVPPEVLDMKEDTCPFNDGDLKSYDGYEGTYTARAASQYAPIVVDGGNAAKGIEPQTILDKNEIYAGCYGKASVTAWTWGKKQGKKGISFGLRNVQKVADGEPFSGRSDPLEDFEAIVPEEIEVADTNDLFGNKETENKKDSLEGL